MIYKWGHVHKFQGLTVPRVNIWFGGPVVWGKLGKINLMIWLMGLNRTQKFSVKEWNLKTFLHFIGPIIVLPSLSSISQSLFFVTKGVANTNVEAFKIDIPPRGYPWPLADTFLPKKNDGIGGGFPPPLLLKVCHINPKKFTKKD